MTQTVEVQVQDFRRGLRYARQWGRYNPVSKTWTLDVAAMGNAINAPANYGLRVVSDTLRCRHYEPDQGCPLHGEYCQELAARGDYARLVELLAR